MNNLEKFILKELDRLSIDSSKISIIMNNLNSVEKKNNFLSFMIENRNILISFNDIVEEIRSY